MVSEIQGCFPRLADPTMIRMNALNAQIKAGDKSARSRHAVDVDDLTTHATRLETLLKNLPGMAYRCLNLQHWPMDFVSNGCYELCGYHRHEIESQKILWGDFTHPDDVNEVHRVVAMATDANTAFEVEYRIITRDGDVKWVWERGRPIDVRDDGVAILEGFITDITDRKISEDGLISAKAYADAIVDSAAEGIITTNSRGYIESFNNAARNMFGFALDTIVGQHCRTLVSDAHQSALGQYFIEANSDDLAKEFSLELDGIHENGEMFPVHFSVNRIDSAIDNQFVILTRDLSAQRAAETEAREQRELLAHADRLNTLGEMAAGIAHELNQPLTAISMYARSGLRFLNQDNPRLDRLQEALDRLSAQAKRAGAVMERMQLMTRQRDSEQEVVDPGAMLREVHRLAEVEARIRSFEIGLDIEPGLPAVRCDPIQIHQVILNLLRNGMESMSIAGRAQNEKILLSAALIDNSVEISIDDCGCGISVELSKKLYQPFTSTKSSGMGLGLSISRSIVTAHGGKLLHKNNRRGGATFYFQLPGVADAH